MRYVSIVCDVCGAEKRMSNGWITARRDGRKLIIVAHPDHGGSDDGWTDVCGSSCLLRWVARNIEIASGGSAEAMLAERVLTDSQHRGRIASGPTGLGGKDG